MTPPRPAQERSPAVDQEEIWTAGPDDPEAPGAGMQAVAPMPGSAAASPGGASRPTPAAATWTHALTSTDPLPGPGGLLFADAPNRVIAFILDLIVLAILGMLVALVVGGIFGGLSSGRLAAGGALDSTGGDLNVGAFLVVGVAQMAVSFAYFAYTWVMTRGTPGMKMLGLRIGDQGDGHAISWNQALVRWLLLGIPATLSTFAVYVPNVVGLVLGISGVAWLAVLLTSLVRSPRRQGLHDRYGRTVVLRAPRRAT